MPITALGFEIVSESSGHQVVPMAPNVCITPAAPSPLPLPYPIMGSSSKLAKGTEKTKIAGKKVLNADGQVNKVQGNEAGTQKDIITFQTSGKAWALPVPAVTVLFEGKPVTVTGNMGFGNTM